MKSIHFSIDLRSFFLGALTVTGVLLMANFKPSEKNQPEPHVIDTRRYQAITGTQETIILDTQTGRFINSLNSNWRKGDFEEIVNKQKK